MHLINYKHLIDKTANWIESNGLVINTSKWNCIVIGTKCNSEHSQINVNINGNKLNQISETKLLGIHIDEKSNMENTMYCNI